MPSASQNTRTALQRWRSGILGAAPGLEAAEILFDSVSDVLFCVKTPDRRYAAVNEAFLRATGLRTKAAIIGLTAQQVFPPLLAAGYEQQDREIFSRGTAVRDRLEMITRGDGGIGWFVSQKVPVRSSDGSMIALAGISRDLGTPAAEGGVLGPLTEALHLLHTDVSGSLRIGDLAKRSGLSWSQFERRVSALTGLTPRQLLTKSRIEAAARALRDSDTALGTVAIDCGFYDQAAFSRQFRAVTGLSPGEFRRAFRQ